eukprot:1603591-Pyramimonas_sp.AAC.3
MARFCSSCDKIMTKRPPLFRDRPRDWTYWTRLVFPENRTTKLHSATSSPSSSTLVHTINLLGGQATCTLAWLSNRRLKASKHPSTHQLTTTTSLRRSP